MSATSVIMPSFYIPGDSVLTDFFFGLKGKALAQWLPLSGRQLGNPLLCLLERAVSHLCMNSCFLENT